MEVDVVVNLGTALTTIGVMVTLFVRVDKRIDGVDTRIDGLARELVDVKVSVARIEGHLDARSGYMRAGDGRFVPEAAADHPSTGHLQTG